MLSQFRGSFDALTSERIFGEWRDRFPPPPLLFLHLTCNFTLEDTSKGTDKALVNIMDIAEGSMIHLDPALCDGDDMVALATHKSVTLVRNNGDSSIVRTPDGHEHRVQNSQLERAIISISSTLETAVTEGPEE